jgi:hypothetical protein
MTDAALLEEDRLLEDVSEEDALYAEGFESEDAFEELDELDASGDGWAPPARDPSRRQAGGRLGCAGQLLCLRQRVSCPRVGLLANTTYGFGMNVAS